MINRIPFKSGVFTPFYHGHALTFKDQPVGEFELGQKYSINTMIGMWDLLKDSQQVGFFFSSAFKMENKGGYLVTFLESKRGKATSGSLVIRHEEVMVYDFPQCGSMAVSTRVSDKMMSIFMGQ